MATPVEVWAPPFEWLEELTIENTQSFFNDRVWCKLCETTITFGPDARERHVRAHRRERKEWRKKRDALRRRDAAARLRESARLKREAARATSPAEAKTR